MNAKRADVPHEVLARLRLVCLDLSEAYEEEAWAGTRWMVVKKNFAHVLMIDAGWPPAYARAAGADGPLCVLTFRISAAATGALRFERPPFFRPVWWPNIVGLTLDANTDWDEVAALLTRSYRVLAPKKLAALVDGVSGIMDTSFGLLGRCIPFKLSDAVEHLFHKCDKLQGLSFVWKINPYHSLQVSNAHGSV